MATAQEKAARLREIRERLNQAGPKFHVLTPAERESKRTELQQRVQAQVDLLRKRQAESTLSEQETRRLERMEAMAKRLAAGEVLGPLQKTE